MQARLSDILAMDAVRLPLNQSIHGAQFTAIMWKAHSSSILHLTRFESDPLGAVYAACGYAVRVCRTGPMSGNASAATYM